MEKRILIAAILSAVFMTWYAQAFLPKPVAPATRPSAGVAEPVKPPPVAATPILPILTPREDHIALESPSLRVEIGETSAAIRSVVLKTFLDTETRQPLQIRSESPLLAIQVDEQPLLWEPEDATRHSATFKATGAKEINYYISYSIDQSNSNVTLSLRTKNDATTKKIWLLGTWARADQLSDRYNSLELVSMSVDKNTKNHYATYRAPVKNQKNVPRGTTILALSERYFCQAIRVMSGAGESTLLPSTNGTIAARIAIPISGHHQEQHLATVYFGPRDYFYLKDAGFDGTFPIGMLGQLGLMLLYLLNGIAKIVHNYGVAVVLFSALVTCAMAPFTLISFRSMKKLQELKPQMDKITAKHKDNPQQANQEIFALYRQHRVNPLSGCLPMLLQLPIFFALFQAISHYVELRGKGFLWIADLSLPDRIAKLPFSLPLLGSDVNLLPILMALAMFVQQKLSQQSMPASAKTPGMNLMSGPLMAVLFGVMFYQFPAGLVLYWLTNSLISLAWYRLAK
jgi:YidC/Oxa1 family membrane protein insertase